MPEPNPHTRYLRVMGRLYSDRRMTLRPGYLTETPPWNDRDRESPLRADVFDPQGTLLGSFPLRVAEMCREGGKGESLQSVRGFVPFHPLARRVVFAYRGEAIHEITRSDESPRARWSWHPQERMTGQRTVTWTADHPAGLAVECFLRYSWDDGRTWSRLTVGDNSLSQVVDFDQLPGGEHCVLALVATDGINTTSVDSARFSVPRKACVAMIQHPLEGSRHAADEPVLLHGQGFWREENRPEFEQLAWYTSSDTQPASTGRLGQLQLAPGQHTITLLAGNEPHRGRAEVTIVVGEVGDHGSGAY